MHADDRYRLGYRQIAAAARLDHLLAPDVVTGHHPDGFGETGKPVGNRLHLSLP